MDVSTNYYWLEDGKSHCSTCGCHEKVHIGASRLGWKFLLHLYSDRHILSLSDWKYMWTGTGIIEDEYGRPVSKKEMVEVITDRNLYRDGKKTLKPHDDYSGYGGMPVPVVVEGAQYDTWLDVDFT